MTAAREAHDAYVATLTDEQLRAGDDLIINPTPQEFASTSGRWCNLATHYGLSFADLYPDIEGDVLP